MTNKPREFWIYPFKPTKMLFTYTEPNELKQSAPENFDEIHVIEYSAYQALLEQAERMEKVCNALERWANAWASQDTSDTEPARKAMLKALNEWKEFKK